LNTELVTHPRHVTETSSQVILRRMIKSTLIINV